MTTWLLQWPERNSILRQFRGIFKKKIDIMKKIVLFILLMLPVAVFGQEKKDSIPNSEWSAVFEKMKEWPHAFQTLIMKSMISNVDIENREVRYTLSNGDIVIGKLADDESMAYFWKEVVLDNQVKEICNIPFGCTLMEAKDVLRKKFGDALYVTDDVIMYENKSYAGNRFDTLIFMFQSDGRRNYFNQAAFCIYVSDKEEAIATKNRLHKRLSKRYPSMIGEDLDVSMGGLQPVPNSHLVNEVVVGCTTSELGYGFEIKIIENDDYRHPYFVRIMYGPYEYVKEDF